MSAIALYRWFEIIIVIDTQQTRLYELNMAFWVISNLIRGAVIDKQWGVQTFQILNVVVILPMNT